MPTREPAIGRSSGAPDPSAPEGTAQQKDPTHHYPSSLFFWIGNQEPKAERAYFSGAAHRDDDTSTALSTAVTRIRPPRTAFLPEPRGGARTRPPRLRVVLVPAPCPYPCVLLLVCYSCLARALLVPTRARATCFCSYSFATRSCACSYSSATRPLLARYSSSRGGWSC